MEPCPVTPLLRCDPRMGATTVSLMDGDMWRWAENIPSGFEPGFEPRLAHYSNVTHIMVCLARLRKTHTYPVWGMTTLRQFRSPPAAPVPVLSHWSITAIENAQSGV